VSELAQEPVRERALHSRDKSVAVLIMLTVLAASLAAFLQQRAATDAVKADRQSRIDGLVSVEFQVAADDADSEQAALLHTSGDLFDRAAATASEGGAYAQALAAAQRDAASQLVGLPASVFIGYGLPNGGFDDRRFFADQIGPRYAAEELGKAYAQTRGDWIKHRGRYLAAITLFAVAVFLFGLTLTTPAEARRWVIAAGALVGLGGLGLVAYTSAKGVSQPKQGAIYAYAHAAATSDVLTSPVVALDRPLFESIVADTTRAIRLRRDYEAAYQLRAYARLALDLTSPRGPRGSKAALADDERATALDSRDYFAWVDRARIAFWLGDYKSARAANERAYALVKSRPGVVLQQALLLKLTAPAAEYSAFGRKVFDVFRGNPLEARRGALDELLQTRDLVRAYRPAIAAAVDAVYADAAAVERQLGD